MKPFWISLVLLVAVANLIAGFAPPLIPLQHFTSGLWIGAAFLIVPSIVFAWVLPHLKVGAMASVWGVPKNTFLCSRPLLRLCGSAAAGNLVGTMILALFVGEIYVPMLVMHGPSTIVYLVSVGKRFRRHPQSEFAMPMSFPYPLTRPMRRSRFR